MSYKLIVFNNNQSYYREAENINFYDYYLTNMEGFPVTLSSAGDLKVIHNFSILGNNLIAHNDSNESWGGIL